MEFITDFWPWLILVFAIVSVGGYGLFSHAVKHTDGTDDIRTADGEQKGLMSSTHHADIETLKTDLSTAVAAIVAAQAAIDALEADLNGFPDELKNLITHEIQQLATLGDSVTISATQWGILGAAVEWTNWVPTLTGGADLSGYNEARYFRIGHICFYVFRAVGKNVTTAGVIQITLPFACANTTTFHPTGSLKVGAVWTGQPYMVVDQNTDYIHVWKNAAAGNWAGDETIILLISGFFEIA